MLSPLEASPARDAAPAPIEPPHELRAFPQWVGWSYRPTKSGLAKVPHCLPPRRGFAGGAKALAQTASTADPSTWASYEAARPHQSIGFVFTEEDPFFGVDLDECLNPATGELSLVARVAVRYLASYAEISPSGRGVKIVARGRIPQGTSRRQNRKLGVEMYGEGRFFALTGDRLPAAPAGIADADPIPLYRWIFGPPEDRAMLSVNTNVRTFPAAPRGRSDEEVIGKALGARNGHRFGRLWRGDASGYPTRSEADLALCAMLVYWCGPDPARVEALFSRSGLSRKKWRDRSNYRRRTIERAIATTRA